MESFRLIVAQAGFGGGGRNHTLSIGLTEAEAAAVHTSTEASGIFKVRLSTALGIHVHLSSVSLISSKENDVLLVVDAGGGTTVRAMTLLLLRKY